MGTASFFETNDGTKIYFEDHGQGQPILFVHGWLCSSRFWQKNVPELKNELRVVTIDLRGHGNSSKTLTGHTIAQYARDVRRLIEHLDIHDVVLAGWSLGGPVVLSYYQQYSYHSRLKALSLIDTCLFPFSPESWNSHVLSGFNYDRLHATLNLLREDPRKFSADFTARMFKQNPSEADANWIVAEMLKTPPWIAGAIYSDFVMSDFFRTLPSVEVPVLVFAANSLVFPNGIAMGKAIAREASRATCIAFEDSGHILFYEQPQKFNAAMADFVKSLQS